MYYSLQATAEPPETAYSMAVEETTSMEWHSPHLTETMTWLMEGVHKPGGEDGGTTSLCAHNRMALPL